MLNDKRNCEENLGKGLFFYEGTICNEIKIYEVAVKQIQFSFESTFGTFPLLFKKPNFTMAFNTFKTNF